MRTLIITEKPSVAGDFAKALGVRAKRDGYFEGEDYLITWAFGHLLELAEPEDYDPVFKRWSMKSLPIIPDKIRYKPIQKTKKQLGTIGKLLKSKGLERVVIATDAGREGEVIARTILQASGETDAALFRFWTSQALTPQVVRQAMEGLKPASEYDRLWHAGQARQIADWLVGMNFTRAATLRLKQDRSRDVYSVGRVQTAVLALLVDRRRERDNFKPVPYWVVRARMSNDKGSWWGTWFKGEETRISEKNAAESIIATVTGQTGIVISVKKEKKKQAPPMLYSLTELQRDGNTRYGFSAKQVLDIAQALYEQKKCLSYPRTDSRVLGSQNVEMVRDLVTGFQKTHQDMFSGVVQGRLGLSNKRVFNDARLTDHHALIPLAPLPDGCTRGEKLIHDLVLKRFAEVFHPDYEYEATEIVSEVLKEKFRTRGNRPLVPGWKLVSGIQELTGQDSRSRDGSEEDPEQQDLPPLSTGDPAQILDAIAEENTTKPQPEYNDALLLKDMTNPGRYVSEEELQKIFSGNVGLGTQATRAQIIETLLTRHYLERDKKKLIATDKGCFLIDSLRQLQTAKFIATPEQTARWEMDLEQIAAGTGDGQAFIKGIRNFVAKGVIEFKRQAQTALSSGPLGTCPACGGDIVEGEKGFGCSRWRQADGRCRFVIWKEIAGRRIDEATVRQLLTERTSRAMKFSSGEQELTTRLILGRDEQGRWEVLLAPPEPDPAREDAEKTSEPPQVVYGKCPKCGGDVVEGKKGYGCTMWRPENGGCRFVIWKTIAGKKLPTSAVKRLLSSGKSDMLKGFRSKTGNKFSAKLKIEAPEFVIEFDKEK